MTEAQLKAAAITYCVLMGVDPFQPDYSASPSYTGPTFGTPVHPPEWEGMTVQIKKLNAMLEAIEFAKGVGE